LLMPYKRSKIPHKTIWNCNWRTMDTFYRDKVFDYVSKKYNSKIEFLWARFPDDAIFRHNDNRKWYGIVMGVLYKKLGIDREGKVYVLNVKIDDPSLLDFLLHQQGFFGAYHQTKGKWISISLDGSVPFPQIKDLIDMSYIATSKK